MQPDFPDLPQYLRIPQDARRAAWQGRKLTRPRPMTSQPKATDPSTIRLLAELAADEKARAKVLAKAKEDAAIIRKRNLANIRAVKRAAAEVYHSTSTDGVTMIVHNNQTVISRLKARDPKPVAPLAKPRPERAARRAPDSTSSHNIKLSEIDPKVAAAVKAAAKPKATKKPAAKKGPAKKPAKVAKPKAAAKIKAAPKASAPKAPKPESKGAKLEAMLRKSPISVAEIAEQLEWLPHTTRAAISRVGFEVTTEKKDGVTLYHIAKDAAAKAKA